MSGARRLSNCGNESTSRLPRLAGRPSVPFLKFITQMRRPSTLVRHSGEGRNPVHAPYKTSPNNPTNLRNRTLIPGKRPDKGNDNRRDLEADIGGIGLKPATINWVQYATVLEESYIDHTLETVPPSLPVQHSPCECCNGTPLSTGKCHPAQSKGV